MSEVNKTVIFTDNSLKMFLNFRYEVLMSFYNKGYDINIIVPENSIEQKLIAKLPVNIRINGIKFNPNSTNPLTDITFFFKLFNLYKKIKPDIIFHYTIKPNIYGSLAAKLLNIKNISVVAGLGYVFSGNNIQKKIGRRLYKFGLNQSSKVFVLNENNYNILLKGKYVKRDNLLWLKGGEGVNLNKFYPNKNNNFSNITFLMIGRLLYPKGYHEFVEAAKYIKQVKPETSFEIIGPMDLKSPMGVKKEEIDRDCSNEVIKYSGESYNIPTIMRKEGTVLVLPSYYPEGLNRTLMEGCASGIPIITTDIPGCKETVDIGKNGFLVTPMDTNSLIENILKFINLRETDKLDMCRHSREKAENEFDMSTVIDIYHNNIN